MTSGNKSRGKRKQEDETHTGKGKLAAAEEDPGMANAVIEKSRQDEIRLKSKLRKRKAQAVRNRKMYIEFRCREQHVICVQ